MSKTIDQLQTEWWALEELIKSGRYGSEQIERFKVQQELLHDEAERIRSTLGYSGGDAGSEIIITDQSTYDRTFASNDPTEFIEGVEKYYTLNAPIVTETEPKGTKTGSTVYNKNGTSLTPGIFLAGAALLIFLLRR